MFNSISKVGFGILKCLIITNRTLFNNYLKTTIELTFWENKIIIKSNIDIFLLKLWQKQEYLNQSCDTGSSGEELTLKCSFNNKNNFIGLPDKGNLNKAASIKKKIKKNTHLKNSLENYVESKKISWRGWWGTYRWRTEGLGGDEALCTIL